MVRQFRMLTQLAVALSVWATGSATAEEGVDTFGALHLIAGEPGALALDGELPVGLAGTFMWALSATGVPERLVLNSLGGIVEEALLIADMVRTLRIETVIPEGAKCYSACVLIFFAGVGREAIGELGLHEFFGTTDRGGVALADPALSAIGQAELLRYGADPGLVALAWATPRDQFHVLSAEEIAAFRVNRTREEGLRLAPEEDYAVPEPIPFAGFEVLAEVGPPATGVSLTIHRSGAPDATHLGYVQWAANVDQGTVRAHVEIPDLNVAYRFLFAPFAFPDQPFFYGGTLVTKVDTAGMIQLEPIYQFGVAIPAPGTPEDVPQTVTIVTAVQQILGMDSVLLFPRLLRETNVARLGSATAVRALLSVDGTLDHTIEIIFDIGTEGRAAFASALPRWDGR